MRIAVQIACQRRANGAVSRTLGGGYDISARKARLRVGIGLQAGAFSMVWPASRGISVSSFADAPRAKLTVSVASTGNARRCAARTPAACDVRDRQFCRALDPLGTRAISRAT
jgi:hypothetical protein